MLIVQKSKKKKNGRKSMDFSLLFIIIFLLCFGLVMLYSTSSYNAFIEHNDAAYYLKKQIMATGFGVVVMIVVANIDYAWLKKVPWLAYIVAAILILLVLTPLGITLNGARRWIGIAGISLQPAEVAKLSIIIFLSAYIVKLRRRMGEIKVVGALFASSMPLVGFILIITKNMSSAIIILGIAFIMVFVASPKYKYFIATAVGVLAAGVLVILVGSGFRMQRIQAWLHPEQFSDTTAYQTLQSLYAIGSGGLVGKGLGQSVQKLGYIPEAQNDMIFSIICEELGLFGGIAVILLFAFMIWRFMIIATNARDLFGSMLVTGVMAHIAIQVILNVAVVTNTIPNTGITLPFISYGGTSILFLLIEMGIALSVSRYERETAVSKQ